MNQRVAAIALLCSMHGAFLGACKETARGTTRSAMESRPTIPGAGASGANRLLDEALLQKICTTATCAGELSGVQVYRTTSGEPALYLHEGDLQRCSHPPYTYFDTNGKQVLVQAERPIRSSKDAKKLSDERDALLAGLIEAELLLCSEYRPTIAGIGHALRSSLGQPQITASNDDSSAPPT
jgi:hypothetical protein